jgi:hypothetical protein
MLRDVVLVVPQSPRLRADGAAANLGAVDPQDVPRVRRQAKRSPLRNIVDVEDPAKESAGELRRRKIATNARRVDHELGHVGGHPVSVPPHAREVSARH